MKHIIWISTVKLFCGYLLSSGSPPIFFFTFISWFCLIDQTTHSMQSVTSAILSRNLIHSIVPIQISPNSCTFALYLFYDLCWLLCPLDSFYDQLCSILCPWNRSLQWLQVVQFDPKWIEAPAGNLQSTGRRWDFHLPPLLSQLNRRKDVDSVLLFVGTTTPITALFSHKCRCCQFLIVQPTLVVHSVGTIILTLASLWIRPYYFLPSVSWDSWYKSTSHCTCLFLFT